MAERDKLLGIETGLNSQIAKLKGEKARQDDEIQALAQKIEKQAEKNSAEGRLLYS